MRRRTTPIGWPCRDPRHYRFAVSNAVWKCKLKPVEFVIFSCLCYHRAPGVLAPEMIAADVHVTAGTVKKYLTALRSKGIVSEDGTPVLKCKDKKFFTLPNEVFLLRLPPSAFMVYAYLLLIENRQTHTCHPSYNTIADATGMSKNTVIKSIGAPLEMGLIAVEPSSYFDKHGLKWKGNNLYTILPVGAAADAFYRRQLHQLELDAERRRVLRRQAEYDRRHSRAALRAPASTRTTPDPLQQVQAPVRPLKAGVQGDESIAGESPGAFHAPGQGLLPTVRAVAGTGTDAFLTGEQSD